MPKRLTMQDVADLANVSTTTVSHVINNTRYVSEETRQKVESAMSTLGYYPNTIARGLRSGETKTIGLLVPDTSNPFFAEVARRIEDLGFERDYSVILGNSDNNAIKQLKYINTLIAKQVDGVIFISTGGEKKSLSALADNKVPTVVADREIAMDFVDVVLLNNEEAGYTATNYLLKFGHRCIGCITGPDDLSPSMKRVEGYKRALEEYNIPFKEELIASGDFRYQGGELAMMTLLEGSCLPTAVFVLNDMMAIGAMKAIRKANLSIPNDISVLGFDNIELASAITPALTTMAQPLDDLAENAINLLIDRINNKSDKDIQQVILSARLIERESVSRKKES